MHRYGAITQGRLPNHKSIKTIHMVEALPALIYVGGVAVAVGLFLIEGVNVSASVCVCVKFGQCVCVFVCVCKCLFGSYASVFLGPLVVTVD